MGEQFDPIRLVAELNAMGVRFVLAGDLASPSAVLAQDRLAVYVADDEEDIDRLRALLIALDAEQDELSDDPHRAVFRTPLGRVEVVELPADTAFAELERRAGHVDFGNGVIARSAPKADAAAHRLTTPATPVIEVHDPDQTPEELADDRTPVTRRIWQRLEPKLERIDELLSGSARPDGE